MHFFKHRRLSYAPILLTMAGLFSALLMALILWDAYQGRPGFASNFDPFYRAGLSWLGEISAYCLDCDWRDFANYVPFLNPPVSLFLFWPLQFLGRNAALVLFTLANLGFWWTVLFSRGVRALLPRLASNRLQYALAVLVLPLPFVVYNVNYGQLGLFYAGLALLGAANLQSRPRLAGLALGLLIIKPPLGLMVPVLLLAGRHWRAMGACLASVAVLCLAATAYFGWQSWLDWLAVMRIHSEMTLPAHMPRGFLTQMVSVYGGALILGYGSATVYAAQAIASVSALLLLAWQARRKPAGQNTALVFFAATLMATPYILGYDAVLMAVAVLIWLDQSLGAAQSPTLPRTLKVGAMALLLIYPTFHSKLLAIFAPFPISAALLLLMACMVAWTAVKTRDA